MLELKKLDLFDLGIILIVASMGGMDVISEEFISQIPNLNSSCCFFHAFLSHSKSALPKNFNKKAFLALKRITERLSP